jgi:hypothetical protein
MFLNPAAAICELQQKKSAAEQPFPTDAARTGTTATVLCGIFLIFFYRYFSIGYLVSIAIR